MLSTSLGPSFSAHYFSSPPIIWALTTRRLSSLPITIKSYFKNLVSNVNSQMKTKTNVLNARTCQTTCPWPYHSLAIIRCVTILLLTFPHSFFSYILCMLLPHPYYFLFTFLFPSTDFLFFHVQPYCLCIASCTVRLLMHSPAQSCTVCLLMHSLLRHSLVTQYIRTG